MGELKNNFALTRTPALHAGAHLPRAQVPWSVF